MFIVDVTTYQIPRLSLHFSRSLGVLPRLLRGYCLLRFSSESIDYRAVNTTASKGALFLVPLLREPPLGGQNPLLEDRTPSLPVVSGTPGALDRHTQQPLCYASCMIRPAQSRVFETGVRGVVACLPSSSPCRALTWYPQAPIAVQSSTRVPSGQRT